MDATEARYWEYLSHEFYDGLMVRAEIDHVRPEDLEDVYSLGYNYFTCGKYEAARDVFARLCRAASSTAYYWRALGAVNQQLKDYRAAIDAYDMAIRNDELDVVSYVYRGESEILSGNTKAGIDDLEKVVQIGADYLQFEPWVERAQLLLGVHKQP